MVGEIQFNRPVDIPETRTALERAIASGHLAGNGPITQEIETLFVERIDKQLRLTSSGTHALEMMGILTQIQPGDEVIVPSFTFVSTANAFALRGARLRFADNDRFGNILPSEIERLRSKKTKAVVAVDYGGGSADLDAIREICDQYNIYFFEDAAQGVGALYKGRPLGTLGDLGCYSFHETKNITSGGEGGGLIFGKESFMELAEIVREKGTNRKQFLEGRVDKYSWVSLGSSYVLSELNAAYLLPQVPMIDAINARRSELWQNYHQELAQEFAKMGAEVLETPAYNQSNAHVFGIVFANSHDRLRFSREMKEQGIPCPFHYIPLHSSPYGLSLSNDGLQTLPNCDQISSCLVRLPLHYHLSMEQQDYVIDRARTWIRQRSLQGTA